MAFIKKHAKKLIALVLIGVGGILAGSTTVKDVVTNLIKEVSVLSTQPVE